jgi:hypothetical protein
MGSDDAIMHKIALIMRLTFDDEYDMHISFEKIREAKISLNQRTLKAFDTISTKGLDEYVLNDIKELIFNFMLAIKGDFECCC